MVRELSHVVSKVNWSRFGSGWSRIDTFLGRVLADFFSFLVIFGHFWPFLVISAEMHKAEKHHVIFSVRIFGTKNFFWAPPNNDFDPLFFFAHFWARYLLENPRFTWRRVGLSPGWCGNGPMLFLKSIRVGLDRVGGDQRRFGGEFWRVFVIFGPFLENFAKFFPTGQ